MKNKNRQIKEGLGDDGTTVYTSPQELTRTVDALKGKEVDVQVVPNSMFTEVDSVIEPQDQETIKYLSNVIDDKTGKVSQPFNIADKNYQMVRGMKPNKEVVLSVMCLDDSKIYEVEQFEKEIALPMKEMLEKQNQQNVSEDDTNEIKEMSLSEYKHY